MSERDWAEEKAEWYTSTLRIVPDRREQFVADLADMLRESAERSYAKAQEQAARLVEAGCVHCCNSPARFAGGKCGRCGKDRIRNGVRLLVAQAVRSMQPQP